MNIRRWKYSYCKTRILAFAVAFFMLFVFLFPLIAAARSYVSESWQDFVYSRVYYSSISLEVSTISEINYAYSGSYDESDDGQSVSAGEKPEPRKLDSDTVILSDKMVEMAIQGGVGFVEGMTVGLVFASFPDVDADAITQGVLFGGFMGAASSLLSTMVVTPVVRDSETKGVLLGMSLGALRGALIGATTGWLLLKDTPGDEPFSGPKFGKLAGGIFGGIFGALVGGGTAFMISEDLGYKSPRVDIVQNYLAQGETHGIEKKSDSSKVGMDILEIPKPPLSIRKICGEIVGCTYAGYFFGGLSQLLFRENDFAWSVAIIVPAQALCLSPQGFGEPSRYQYVDGNYNCAFLFGCLGMFLSHEFIESKPLFIISSPLISSTFAAVAWNITRRYENYGVTKTGLLNLNDDRVILGNPSMYIHSDPFGQKEIAYGFELIRFKF